MTKYSSYEIINPLTWHSITPLQKTYPVMINGTPWGEKMAHRDTIPITGIDLEKMEIYPLHLKMRTLASH
jgi:hypothetical protein